MNESFRVLLRVPVKTLNEVQVDAYRLGHGLAVHSHWHTGPGVYRSTRPWLLDGTNAKSPSRGQQMFTKVALAFHVQGVTFPRARATDPIFARLR